MYTLAVARAMKDKVGGFNIAFVKRRLTGRIFNHINMLDNELKLGFILIEDGINYDKGVRVIFNSQYFNITLY